MVPFSFSQAPLISRGMRKHSSTIEVWTLGAWHLELGAFALSCFRAFLILIPVLIFGLRSATPRFSGKSPLRVHSCPCVVKKSDPALHWFLFRKFCSSVKK